MHKIATSEESTHEAIARYIKLAYPKVIFNTDLSGIRLTPGLAAKVKRLRSSNAFPDIAIYEPRRGFAGLFIELKRPTEKIYKKDGTLRKNTHIEEQAQMLKALEQRGFYAIFAVGFVAAKEVIDWYIGERKGYEIKQ